MRLQISAVALSLLLGNTLLAEKLPKPSKLPVAPTGSQKRIVAEGIVLFGAGDFDKAIEKYELVLTESPDELLAMYELGYTYFVKKDYKAALDVGRRGAHYQSPLLPRFHVLMGNCLDEMGKREDAINVYRSAIQVSPREGLVQYNLALTFYRSGKLDDARKSVQQAVLMAPAHTSSHVLLGAIYQETGYRIPAILAYSRFLQIEADSPRSRQILATVDRLIAGGVTQGSDPNKINITLALTPDAKKDEGDFGGAEMAMSMSIAAGRMGESKKKSTPLQLLAATYGVMGSVIADMKGKGFAAKYYCPFFSAISKNEFTEAYVYDAFQAARIAGAEEWGKENQEKLRQYREWADTFQWLSSK